MAQLTKATSPSCHGHTRNVDFGGVVPESMEQSLTKQKVALGQASEASDRCGLRAHSFTLDTAKRVLTAPQPP